MAKQTFTEWLLERLAANGHTVPSPVKPAKLTAAIRAFQKAKGLPQTGTANEATIAALREGKKDVTPAAIEPGGIPLYMKLAFAELGVREIVGNGHNPRVVKYSADAGQPGIKNDEVPWCGAFVGAMLARAGIVSEVPVSLRLWARAYLRLGKKLTNPVYGCVGVKSRGKASGHVGFVVAANNTSIWLLGGNQGNGVTIARFARSEFLGFRMPTGVSTQGLPKLPASSAGVSNPSQA